MKYRTTALNLCGAECTEIESDVSLSRMKYLHLFTEQLEIFKPHPNSKRYIVSCENPIKLRDDAYKLSTYIYLMILHYTQIFFT